MQAYIVPKNDEFFNTSLKRQEDRLYKLTNFTGSNGLAVIFADPNDKKSLFITDSRYKL